MKWISRVSIIILALVCLLAPTRVSPEQSPGDPSEWWKVPYPKPFEPSGSTPKLDFLHVDGNRFVDEEGNPVVLQGVSISDPDKLVKNGRWSRRHFEIIEKWGAEVVRVPVHPVAWRGRGRDGYFELLDQAVNWAAELGLYLMIDWHSIGNLQSGLFQHPMYDTTKRETLEFWRSVAFRYQNIPTVAFYEIFNEPTVFNGTLGGATWEKWKEFNEEVVGIIFAHDRKVIPLVAGFDWAYDLKPVGEAPIEVEGIGYVSHPYPQKVSPPFEEKWERDFGFVADRYPVFVTEFGYMGGDEPGAHVPVIAGDDYGKAITEYMEKKGISWAAWCFDPDWGPHLISDWEYTPTGSGLFFRQVMSER
jgi:aryl-phospho-beta-D-glucosidase BglC (GH1 family)